MIDIDHYGQKHDSLAIEVQNDEEASIDTQSQYVNKLNGNNFKQNQTRSIGGVGAKQDLLLQELTNKMVDSSA